MVRESYVRMVFFVCLFATSSFAYAQETIQYTKDKRLINGDFKIFYVWDINKGLALEFSFETDVVATEPFNKVWWDIFDIHFNKMKKITSHQGHRVNFSPSVKIYMGADRNARYSDFKLQGVQPDYSIISVNQYVFEESGPSFKLIEPALLANGFIRFEYDKALGETDGKTVSKVVLLETEGIFEQISQARQKTKMSAQSMRKTIQLRSEEALTDAKFFYAWFYPLLALFVIVNLFILFHVIKAMLAKIMRKG